MKLFLRANLREGVYKDVERQAVRQEMKRTINTYNLHQQKEIEKILRKEQEENQT